LGIAVAFAAAFLFSTLSLAPAQPADEVSKLNKKLIEYKAGRAPAQAQVSRSVSGEIRAEYNELIKLINANRFEEFIARAPAYLAKVERYLEPTAVREIMAEHSAWAGTASDLLRARAASEDPNGVAGWPRNPRALAGQLRRSQTFLRTLGIRDCF
jgi:hypothetical protein